MYTVDNPTTDDMERDTFADKIQENVTKIFQVVLNNISRLADGRKIGKLISM